MTATHAAEFCREPALEQNVPRHVSPAPRHPVRRVLLFPPSYRRGPSGSERPSNWPEATQRASTALSHGAQGPRLSGLHAPEQEARMREPGKERRLRQSAPIAEPEGPAVSLCPEHPNASRPAQRPALLSGRDGEEAGGKSREKSIKQRPAALQSCPKSSGSWTLRALGETAGHPECLISVAAGGAAATKRGPEGATVTYGPLRELRGRLAAPSERALQARGCRDPPSPRGGAGRQPQSTSVPEGASARAGRPGGRGVSPRSGWRARSPHGASVSVGGEDGGCGQPHPRGAAVHSHHEVCEGKRTHITHQVPRASPGNRLWRRRQENGRSRAVER